MPVSESLKRAQRRYDDANTKRVYIKLNLGTDQDILKWLDEIQNKQGYIKKLIREDMKKAGR